MTIPSRGAESEPVEALRRMGLSGEGPHDLAAAGLWLASLDRPERKLSDCYAHLSELAEMVRAEAKFALDGEAGARALSSVIAGRFGYEGERLNYDDPLNADMIAVIERRRGLPVALGILYIQTARAGGMEACGLLSPGHFLLRLSVRGNSVVIDPFNNGATVDHDRINPPSFEAALAAAQADTGKPPDPLGAVSDSEVLLRLQNNIKERALRNREVPRAIEILRRMVLIAPRRNLLWLELAQVQESTGALTAARKAYESCLNVSRSGDEVYNEAAFALEALKRRLN